jgi:GT2 family glycosyltransferase
MDSRVTDGAGSESLSVVVCTYTMARVASLSHCVRSLRAQSTPVHEIIVVVDHDPALLAELERSLSEVVLVENRETRGLSGSRNTGVKVASGSIVAFVDDDAYVQEDWAKWLVAAYEPPAVVAVGGAVVPEFETGRPAWFVPEFDWVIGCTYFGHRVDPGPVRNVIGANMSFRSSTLAEVGGFRVDLGRSELFGGGCEETELCIRATRTGPATTWYEPRAVAHHLVPRSRTTARYVRRRCFGEGRSKARVARIAGRDAGLSSERDYAARTLPRAVLRELRSGFRGSLTAWFRLAMIIGGVLTTAAGYAWASGRVGHVSSSS